MSSSSLRPSKAEEIGLVLSEPNVDLWKLREMALTEGGLINDTIRKRAWPKLVGLHESSSQTSTSSLFEEFYVSDGLSAPPAKKTARIVSMTPPEIQEEQKTTTLERANSLPKRLDRLDHDDNDSRSSDGSVVSDSDSPAKRKRKRVAMYNTDYLFAECLDAHQIQRDVARCTWHLLTGSQRSRRLQMKNKGKKRISTLLKRKQRRLGNLINLTLVRSYGDQLDNDQRQDDDKLRYYQGYHDVACIFLSALGGGGSGPTNTMASSSTSTLETTAVATGLDLPSRVLLQVSQSHLRDIMRSNFVQLQAALRLVLLPLIGAFDSQVHAFLWDCDMEPYFCLSWVITWFSHDVRDTNLVKRLFDAFLVSHPLLPIYMSVAMVLHPVNRVDVLRADWGDFSSVHQALVGLTKNSCSVGWKYKVGDGYVSGDEEEDDAATRSTTDNASLLSEELRDDGGASESMISSDLMHVGSNTRVPFQELIDLAITYMRRIPPRNLMRLARRYHFGDEALLSNTSSIALLQPPPSWGLASTTPSDWVLKQRARESHGMSATSRKDRKKRPQGQSRDVGQKAMEPESDNTEEELKKYLLENNKTLAVIASGFGPGDDEERRWRRRKRLFLRASVAVAALAIAYGLAMQYRPDLFERAIEGTADSSPTDQMLDSEPGNIGGKEIHRSGEGEHVETPSLKTSVWKPLSLLKGKSEHVGENDGKTPGDTLAAAKSVPSTESETGGVAETGHDAGHEMSDGDAQLIDYGAKTHVLLQDVAQLGKVALKFPRVVIQRAFRVIMRWAKSTLMLSHTGKG